MSSFEDFADSLMNDPIEVRGPSKNEQQFPCGQCAGTGEYQGARIHQEKKHCFACKGKGYFKTDPRKLQKARVNAAARKQSVKDQFVAEFREEYSDLIAAMTPMISWNSFAGSLFEQLNNGRRWTASQIASAERMVAKVAARDAEKAAARAEKAVDVDLDRIVELFATATASGYKAPTYRALGLRIKPGKGDALYVLNEDRMEEGHFGLQPGYEGKIVGGKFAPVGKTAADTPAKLQAIAADPRGEAIRYGQKTGRCSCCGRELTAHASIDAAIGPICAKKWGL